MAITCFSFTLKAQKNMNEINTLSPGEQNIIVIAAYTAKGDLANLKTQQNAGLDAGLTLNEIKDVLVHL
jgi:alkylhydroperoxidase/carboxymuconolactone decarboxylase family protein YurZ